MRKVHRSKTLKMCMILRAAGQHHSYRGVTCRHASLLGLAKYCLGSASSATASQM